MEKSKAGSPKVPKKLPEITKQHRQRFKELVPDYHALKDPVLEAKMKELHGQLHEYKYLNELKESDWLDILSSLYHTKDMMSNLDEHSKSLAHVYAEKFATNATAKQFLARMRKITNELEEDDAELVQKVRARTLAAHLGDEDTQLDVARMPSRDIDRVLQCVEQKSIEENFKGIKYPRSALEFLHTFIGLNYWGEKLTVTPTMAKTIQGDMPGEEKVEAMRDEVRKAVADKTGVDTTNLKFDDVLAMNVLHGQNVFRYGYFDKVKERLDTYGNLINFFKAERPHYYQTLIDDHGFKEEELEPGEKFTVNYMTKQVKIAKDFTWDKVMPIKDQKKVLRDALALLKQAVEQRKDEGDPGPWKGIGKAIKRGEGEIPDDLVTHDYKHPDKVVTQIFRWIGSAYLPKEDLKKIMLPLAEVRAFKDTADHRERIEKSTSTAEKASLIHEYWTDLIKRHHLDAISRMLKNETVITEINKHAKMIDAAKRSAAGSSFGGEISFRLSERNLKTVCKGYTSEDCSRSGSTLQEAGFGQTIDPGMFNFEMYEGGNWIGNIYSAAVEHNGKNGLLIDVVQPRSKHPLSTAEPRSAKKFAKALYEKLGEWAKKAFDADFIMVSKDPSNRADLRNSLKEAAGDMKQRTVTKLGGLDHLKDFDLRTERMQALPSLTSEGPTLTIQSHLIKL